jgi:hypothetical protein
MENNKYRRLAWSYSNSPSLEDYINKKLGVNKDKQRPIFIKNNKSNEDTTN